MALLGLWRNPGRLLIARRGRPLHVGSGREGHYFGSLPEGLPGRVQAVPDATARVLAHRGGALHLEGAVRWLAEADQGFNQFNTCGIH